MGKFLILFASTFLFSNIKAQNSFNKTEIDSLTSIFNIDSLFFLSNSTCDTSQERDAKTVIEHINCIKVFTSKQKNYLLKIEKQDLNNYFDIRETFFLYHGKVIKLYYKRLYQNTLSSDRIVYFKNDKEFLQFGKGQAILSEYIINRFYENIGKGNY